ncbi:choice-of-anchor J domain-containing protein [Candidatus Calescamantes bacterium]|nr:choice-of-anchor J domain-containing protein [Candidatus Calescamantes bacterium]
MCKIFKFLLSEKRIIEGILFFLLFFTGFLNADSSTFTIKVKFPPPSTKKVDDYSIIQMGNLPAHGNPGEPILPFKPLKILISLGETLENVKVEWGEKITLKGRYLIKPAQYPIPIIKKGSFKIVSPKKSIYLSSKPYPPKSFSSMSIQRLRGFVILPLNLYPVEYIPKEGIISYYKDATVTIFTTPVRVHKGKNLFRGLSRDYSILKNVVDNPSLLKNYGRRKNSLAPSLLDPSEKYDYVIITNDELSPSFQTLIEHKNKRGVKATIVTTDYIYENFGGVDHQEKIRNFIIDAYNNWEIDYVLLGGDDEIIPIRYVYCKVVDPTDVYEGNIPCDMYYGCLDGDWDADGDGVYGEVEDNVDMLAEVYVGRAPVETPEEVNNFVNKVITYENSFDASYHKEVLLVGEKLWDEPETWGGDYKDVIESYFPTGYTITKRYDKLGNFNGDGYIIIDEINEGKHLINHIGHSDQSYVMWIADYEFADICGEYCTKSIENEDKCFIYSQGCYAGAFDLAGQTGMWGLTDECVGENFLRSKYGAFAVVMNSRYGWFQPADIDNSPSQQFDEEFWDAIFNEGIKSVGRANQDSKEDNLGVVGEDETGAYRWCYYELNLLGDPETSFGGSVSREGRIFFDKGRYKDGDEIKLTVMDMDLNIDHENIDTLTIPVTTSGGDSENILLQEIDKNTGIFEGKIMLREGNLQQNNGILECKDGELITATYIDEDDGEGNQVERKANAQADFTPPIIENVKAINILSDRATITWETDEPATSKVYYGTSEPLEFETEDKTLVTSHSITLNNLSQNTLYYFAVQSTDEAGNTSYEDNSGNFYSFITGILNIIFSDDMEEGEGDWQISYDAEEEPQNNWYITENFSYSGSHCWHFCDEYFSEEDNRWYFTYNPGVDPFNGFLISPPIDLKSVSNAMLKFASNFWIGGSQNTWDFGKVEISTDGTTWQDLWEAEDTAGNWREIEVDLTPYCGNTIKIRFHFHCEWLDTGIADVYPGWFIDDVRITSSQASDKDSDGLPDSWENQYFGDLSYGADDDPDGDGFTNLEEYWAGSNPNEGDSEPNLGDVNFDGRVNSADAILCLRIAVGLKIGSPPHNATDREKFMADINRNGSVNSADAILILRKAVGL